jgi:hypothetical protein
MKIVVDTSDIARATDEMREYIRLKSLAGFDTSSDLAAMTAIILEMIDEEKGIPEASDGSGGGRGAGDLFADEDRGWERIVPADSGPLHPDY